MEKALIRHGTSLAIVIDKPVLDLLQITADTKIELTMNGVRSCSRQFAPGSDSLACRQRCRRSTINSVMTLRNWLSSSAESGVGDEIPTANLDNRAGAGQHLRWFRLFPNLDVRHAFDPPVAVFSVCFHSCG